MPKHTLISRGLVVPLLFVAIPLLVLAGAMAAPAFTSTRTSANTCASCHSGSYTMYLSITSSSIPSTLTDKASSIYCNLSVTGNMASQSSSKQSYWLSTLTITASSANGYVGFSGNPKTYSSIQPGSTASAVISVSGTTNGADTITLTAKLAPSHQTSSATVTQTVSGSTQITINRAPTLQGGRVTPTHGNLSQTFAFEVNYTDLDGDAPAHIRCYTNGTPHDMAVKDGVVSSIKTGETYTYSLAASVIGIASSHSFNFTASDGKLPAIGEGFKHNGPSVLNRAPTLQGGLVTPSQGNLSHVFVYEVNYTDLDGDAPAYVRCIANGTSHDMALKDGVGDSITIIETYSVSIAGTVLGAGTAHSFNFTSSDGRSPASGEGFKHNGPDVIMDPPPIVKGPPTCKITDPLSGIFGSVVTISGTAGDDAADTLLGVQVSLAHGPWLPANGTVSWYLSANLSYYPDGPMEILARAYTGIESSAASSVNITVLKSLKNTRPELGFSLAADSVVAAVFWLNGTVYDPELPKQSVFVKAGLEDPPALSANVSGKGTSLAWSMKLDISSMEEGAFVVHAKAWDNFTASIPASLGLYYNKPPVVTLDPLPATVWGPVMMTGTVLDKEENLTVGVSFDSEAPTPASVSGNLWSLTYNFSQLLEGPHSVHIIASDGSLAAQIKASVTVAAPIIDNEPWGAPVLIDRVPDAAYSCEPGTDVEFLVHYQPGDHRGTLVQWYLDAGLVQEGDGNGTAIYAHSFDVPGEHVVGLTVFNKGNTTLKMQTDWSVTVKAEDDVPMDDDTDDDEPSDDDPVVYGGPDFAISPVGPTEIQVVVGELVLMQFKVVLGVCTGIVWTHNGIELDGQYYIYFLPAEPGLAAFTVVANDAFGNTATLHFNVTVLPGKENISEPKTDEGFSPFVSIVIGCILILLLLALIYTFVVVGKSMPGKKEVGSGGANSKAPPKPSARPLPSEPTAKPPADKQKGPGPSDGPEHDQGNARRNRSPAPTANKDPSWGYWEPEDLIHRPVVIWEDDEPSDMAEDAPLFMDDDRTENRDENGTPERGLWDEDLPQDEDPLWHDDGHGEVDI